MTQNTAPMLKELLLRRLARGAGRPHIRYRAMRTLHKFLVAALFGSLPAQAQSPPQIQRDEAQQQIQQQGQATQQQSQQLQQQLQADQARRCALFATHPPLFNPYTARPYVTPHH